jgi:hypothetical protein
MPLAPSYLALLKEQLVLVLKGGRRPRRSPGAGWARCTGQGRPSPSACIDKCM